MTGQILVVMWYVDQGMKSSDALLKAWWWFYFLDTGRQPEVRLAVYRTVQYSAVQYSFRTAAFYSAAATLRNCLRLFSFCSISIHNLL